MEHIPSKLITYDNIKLVAHGKEDELKADLEKRLGLKIIRVEVGNVDFLKDSAILKIYYEPIMDEFGTIDNIVKGSKKF
jgi:O-succinylbenzoate synthase